MKRNNILAKKRLMKTTTYMTALLVAVTMILSSAATVANVNEENISIEKYNPTAPAGTGDFSDTEPLPEPELTAEYLEKELEYSGSYRGVVVYDNDMSHVSLAASHECSVYDAFSGDDFIFGADQDVTGVNWIGGTWNGAHVQGDWAIEFFEDDGTGISPGASFAGPFGFTSAQYTEIPVGAYYEYQVDLPSVVSFDGGQKYWIVIWGTSEYPPQYGFGYHAGIIGAQAVFGSIYFGTPFWTPQARDHAFQLTSAPTHDCFADAILAPLTSDEFCPCTDVEATFYNGGMVDETDVPVSVEIRRYVMVDSFEDPFGVFWDPIPAGNLWMQSPAETAYPFVVTPRTGIFMAELDSGLTGPGAAWLDSLPIDLTGLCTPMMSFYMWHDEYGSDDFIDVQVNFVDVAGPFSRLCCPDCPTGWMEHVVDLSAYAGTSIILSFEGNCDSNPGAYNLQIDDVSIYDQEYFEEDVVDIDAGETVTVEFPQWCPCIEGANMYFDIEVIACTGLETDEVPGNDCISEDVTMYLPFDHDIAAISIDEPVDATAPVQTFEMCGTIKNVGQYEECCFSVYMTVEEQYMIVGPDIPQQDILAVEDFEGGMMPPAGWTITYLPPYTYTWDFNWMYGTPNYAGTGDCAAQDSDWAYVGTAGEMITPAFSTIGLPTPVLEFDAAYNWIGGSEYFAVEVFDGSTWTEELRWTEDHSAYGPGEHVVVDLTAYGNLPTVQVKFIYDDLGTWAWWICVDNVYIQQPYVSGVEVPAYYPPEYEDEYCVDEIDICEEMQICFDDWTPAGPYPDCDEVTYRICLETRMCDPMDENPINDFHCEFITVEFWHDVAINEITSPGDTAIWDVQTVFDIVAATGGQLGNTGAEWDGTNLYTCVWSSNILDQYAADGTHIKSFTAAPASNLRDLAYDGSLIYGGAAAGTIWGIDPVTETVMDTISGGFQARAIAYNSDADTFFVSNWGDPVWEIDRSGAIVDTFNLGVTTSTYGMAYDNVCEDGPFLWVFDQGSPSLAGINQWDLATGAYTGINHDAISDIGYGSAGGMFVATDYVGGTATLGCTVQGGATSTPDMMIMYELCETGPGIDVWLTCGEQDFCATFENLGTFDEIGCTIVWTLNEYNTDPENPTYVAGGTDTIDLAVGEVLEDYCFGSYNFVADGIYELIVEIVAPGVDCYLDNNGPEVVGIGVDCCPPETTFILDPAEPNGENNWYTTSVTATIDAVDCCDPPDLGSGVKEIKYIIDGVEGTIAGDHGTIEIEDDGVHFVELWAIDNAGNEEVDHHTFEVAIDGSDPIVDLIYEAYEEDDGWHVDFTASASDGAGSGIAKVEFYIGSSLEGSLSEAPFAWSIAWQDGYESEDFEAVAYDNAGNEASDVVDGGIIEAVPYFSAQAVPVSLARNI